MSKKKRSTILESNSEAGGVLIEPVVEVMPPNTNGEMHIVFDTPMGHCDDGYASGHLEVNLLPRQAAALKRIRCSLAEQAARTQRRDCRHRDGKVVDSNPDAIRWVLDQCVERYEAAGKDITDGQKF